MIDTMSHDNLLGKAVSYKSQYDADLLFPIARAEGREAIGFNALDRAYFGQDIWNAYELSWLNKKGMPQVAIAEFRFDANTINIVESKSFKLYLNSFNQTPFASLQQVQSTLERDLSAAAMGGLKVKLFSPDQWRSYQCQQPQAILLDELDIHVTDYSPQAALLKNNDGLNDGQCSEVLISHLLRSLCPVTGQPDWASVIIDYQGQAICHEGLLKYIIAYREHQDFHEQCVEKIFKDILEQCNLEKLTVYARYLRRGGLDICPYRSTEANLPVINYRFTRQ